MKHACPPEAAGTATKIARSNCLSNLTRARSLSRRTRRRTSTKCLHSYHCRHPHIAQTFSIAPHAGPCPTLLSSLIKMRVRKVGGPVKFASRLHLWPKLQSQASLSRLLLKHGCLPRWGDICLGKFANNSYTSHVAVGRILWMGTVLT